MLYFRLLSFYQPTKTHMGRLLLFLLIIFPTLTYSQDDVEVENLFSQAIEKNLRKYKYESQEAYHDKDLERATFLYDSLVEHVVIGTHLDNFEMRKRSGRKTDMSKFERPTILLSTASWCTPGAGEIPALNEIAATYHDAIDFVVLFWDTKENTRKFSKDFDKNIKVVYVDESENKNDHVIEKMKHSLGFPTCFLLDENKKIVDVRRTVIHPYHTPYEESFKENYTAYFAGVKLLRPRAIIETDLQMIGVDKN